MSKLLMTALLAASLAAAAVSVGPVHAQTAEEEFDDDICHDHLGALKRIHPEQLAGIVDPQRVWVTEYCVNHSVLPSEGNAAGKRSAIEANEAIVSALRSKGYAPGHVFAIKMMGDDAVTLYVHR